MSADGAMPQQPWEQRLDDPSQALYTVGVVAQLMGVDPQVVRGYDQRGLVEPQRSANGQRRYSRHDIRRLARAMTLADEGIPAAGIERILTLEGQLAERDARELRDDREPRDDHDRYSA